MSLGIPYMGSKRKLAMPILDCICAQNPQAKYFYDLFGGGGAISFEALKRHQFERVTYNELNTGVVELLKKIRDEGATEELYQWVSRETFMKHKGDNNWFGGLLKTCWSFGNNQKCYLFGREIESLKREAHKYLLENGYKGDKKHRLELIKRFKADKNIAARFELENLERLQQLEQLERLEQLEQLENLERLEIKNTSYESVLIDAPISEVVIYCDPPYKNTRQYANKLDHAAFDAWVKASPHKIYVSGYESDLLHKVAAFEHRSTLSATANNKVTEFLFCNRANSTVVAPQFELFGAV